MTICTARTTWKWPLFATEMQKTQTVIFLHSGRGFVNTGSQRAANAIWCEQGHYIKRQLMQRQESATIRSAMT